MKKRIPGIYDGERWAVVPVLLGDNHVAVVVLDCENRLFPVPAQVLIRTGRRVTNSELMQVAASWDEAKPYVPITSDTLRSLGLGEVTSAWAAANAEPTSPASLPEEATAALSEGGTLLLDLVDWLVDFPWPAGGFLGCARQIDLRAKLTRAIVAFAYQAAAKDPETMQRPTQAVAERLKFGESKTRDIVTRARRDGFLTRATHGKSGGTATVAAEQVITATWKYKREHST